MFDNPFFRYKPRQGAKKNPCAREKASGKSLWRNVLIVARLLFFCACESYENDPMVSVTAETQGRYSGSTTAGNLIATAMSEVNDVDIVMYPTRYLNDNASAEITTGMSDSEITEAAAILYSQDNTVYMKGTVKGSNIRRFLRERTLQNSLCDMQVAGLRYDVNISGGMEQLFTIALEDGRAFSDDKYYTVAINRTMFTPTYQWYNNMEYDFYESLSGDIDAMESLNHYLKEVKSFETIANQRCRVRNIVKGDVSDRLISISEIQGVSHLSPFRGMRVKVRGVVTAYGDVAEGADMGARVFFIQSTDEDGDSDPRSSDALFGYLTPEEITEYGSVIFTGNCIELCGIITEDYTEGGLTRTAIRFISSANVLSYNNSLPAAVRLGEGGDTLPPSGQISTHSGNINEKTGLNLNDGVDFWESLEGMRCTLCEPTVVGFYGGPAYDPYDTKTYISLNVAVKGYETRSASKLSAAGGLVIDVNNNDYNCDLVEIVDNDFFRNVWAGSSNPAKCYFSTGDKFGRDIEGILAFAPNFFGEGQYVFYSSTDFGSGTSAGETPLEQRDPSSLVPGEDILTVAAYNLLNLGGDDVEDTQGQKIARSIVTCLHMPDILCLVEVQDNNGPGFSGGSAADETLTKLIEQIEIARLRYAPAGDAVYRYVNIDPEYCAEGGEPGGNIRVAFLYNEKRVKFSAKGKAGALDDTGVSADGSLTLNPGRVCTGHHAFANSRKSMAAEFTFNSEKIILIGNHFKSKLGDSPLWGNVQPVVRATEAKRTEQAQAIHDFVARLMEKNSRANVIVLGDFNDFAESRPMRVLEGQILVNLGTNKLAPAERYSYNYNGNSQEIDHIFVTNAMLDFNPQIDPVHINSNFMFRTSDHDPVLSSFTIKDNSR